MAFLCAQKGFERFEKRKMPRLRQWVQRMQKKREKLKFCELITVTEINFCGKIVSEKTRENLIGWERV